MIPTPAAVRVDTLGAVVTRRLALEQGFDRLLQAVEQEQVAISALSERLSRIERRLDDVEKRLAAPQPINSARRVSRTIESRISAVERLAARAIDRLEELADEEFSEAHGLGPWMSPHARWLRGGPRPLSR